MDTNKTVIKWKWSADSEDGDNIDNVYAGNNVDNRIRVMTAYDVRLIFEDN